MDTVVTKVVARDLCSGCGICVGTCPHKNLVMVTAESGDRVPKLLGECGKNCDLCLLVCPFTRGSHNPRELPPPAAGDTHPDRTMQFHPAIGAFRTAYRGYCIDESVRLQSSSGGLLTKCLVALLESGAINGILIPQMVLKEDGFDYVFHVARSANEIFASGGSIYYPVNAASALREIMLGAHEDDRLAVVGVPCFLAAVKKASALLPKVRRVVRYTLGLACGMYQNEMYTEMLLAKCQCSPAECGKIMYRGKAENRPPNNFAFICKDRNNQRTAEILYDGLPYYLGRHAYFRLNACNYCHDVFAETADACFMDAWLPENIVDWRGTSLVVVRDQAIEETLLNEKRKGHINLEEIEAAKVIRSQSGHIKRKQELIDYRLGRPGPAVTWLEKLDWLLQIKTQKRSKWAWRTLGRKYGVSWFWLGVLDLYLMQMILSLLIRTTSIVGNLLRKTGK